MAKRKQLTEEEKRRKELLELSSVKTGEDINDLMKDFIAEMVGRNCNRRSNTRKERQ